MPMPPSRREVIGEVGRLTLVEIDDPQDAVLVAIRVDPHRMAREGDPIQIQDGVVRHTAGSAEVLLHQRGRHRQRLAGIVEAFLVGRIDGELLGRPQVHTGQVADGVVVFGVAQPARQHRSGITGMLLRLVHPQFLDPRHDGHVLRGGRMLLGLLRRHIAGLELVEDDLPARSIPDHVLDPEIRAEIEVALRLLLVVASEAKTGEERPDRAIEPPPEIALDGVDRRRRHGRGNGPGRGQDQDGGAEGHRDRRSEPETRRLDRADSSRNFPEKSGEFKPGIGRIADPRDHPRGAARRRALWRPIRTASSYFVARGLVDSSIRAR